MIFSVYVRHGLKGGPYDEVGFLLITNVARYHGMHHSLASLHGNWKGGHCDHLVNSGDGLLSRQLSKVYIDMAVTGQGTPMSQGEMIS